MGVISPHISIIMPAYNVENYIEKSINSILTQSFKDFELLVIDDKSEDGTIEVINKFNDPRIILFKNDTNLGQSLSKNSLIRSAMGKYLAFMDADDTCHPDKLKIQYNFLENHKHICGTGTFARIIDDKDERYDKVNLPISYDLIKVHTIFFPSFVHPSLLVRKDEFYDLHNLYYNPEFLYSQDYELYTRMVHRVTMINIPKYLYYIRKWPQQISKKHTEEQINLFLKAIKIQLEEKLRIYLSEEQCEVIRITSRNREKRSLNETELEMYSELLKEIWYSNLNHQVYHFSILKDYLMQRYCDCYSVYKGGYSRYFSLYLKLEGTLFQGMHLKNRLKMFKRYLIDIKR